MNRIRVEIDTLLLPRGSGLEGDALADAIAWHLADAVRDPAVRVALSEDADHASRTIPVRSLRASAVGAAISQAIASSRP